MTLLKTLPPKEVFTTHRAVGSQVMLTADTIYVSSELNRLSPKDFKGEGYAMFL